MRVDVTDVGDGLATYAEVYLDLDNSREEGYDGENDLHMTVPRGGEVIWQTANSAPISEGSSVETVETDDGWRAAFVIPWADYGVGPIVGHRFGMDVHVPVDGDDGRLGKVGWYDQSDEAWEYPRRFAIVELGE